MLLPPAAGAAGAPPGPVRAVSASEARTAQYLDSLRGDPGRLRGFFRRMPKGADLHNHLTGAVSTEYLVKLAAERGLCIDTATVTALAQASGQPCKAGARPAADARTDRSFHDAIVRAWSMQDFPQGGNGHDHFFAAFKKFGPVVWQDRGKLLAQVANGVAEQNQFYLETMVSPASQEANGLADRVGWDADFARMHGKLTAGGKLDKVVAAARKEADDTDAQFRAVNHCGTAKARPGCDLAVRWVSQVGRTGSSQRVFTQLALGMRLAERDNRFAAVNLVQPEDEKNALNNYSQQMRMIKYLRGVYPRAHVTLHAGEVWPGLVKPEELKSHIRQAVHTARAERIGHGVGLVHEDHWQDTARTMADREIAVEVPFTSNAQILKVRGSDHPFATYRHFGVPVVLATDDPGISRTDISTEYQHAAETYDLPYPELKDLARASLEYAFLPGTSLWRDNPTSDGYRPAKACDTAQVGAVKPTGPCERLLKSSPKASAQWRQEAAFTHFENRAGATG
ncbi:adenosine deaminase [Streptomyces sp. NPDC023327]|uniref:adenosine deaminase family protein n=1 Tax=Streptomyces sp. NPDC023327 TaxID=3157088 RepID=UPI0033D59AE3